MRTLTSILLVIFFTSCNSSKGAKVVKPNTHKVWAKGSKYIIDIPIGARHIHLFERKRTKTVNMK